MSRLSNDDYKPRTGEKDEDDLDEGHSTTKSAKFGQQLIYLTRALVKNNIVGQNVYLILLAIEYLCMMYYVLRIVDNTTSQKGFGQIEEFLDATVVNGVYFDQIKAMQQGTSNATNYTAITTNSTFQTAEQLNFLIQNKAYTHIIINCSITGAFMFFCLLFIHKLFKVTSFDKTQEQSYFLKGLSFFMVVSKTIMKLPVLSSVFILINIMVEGICSELFALQLISNTVLVIEFLLIVIYSLKFFNLEVPNDDIAWSHNTTNGLYFKLMLKITLASQELFRDQLHNQTVCIAVIVVILLLEFIIITYRMNTPNIFNTIVHDFTLFLEALIISLTVIGLIALVTKRDILTTMAYLCIFIPVIVKIFFTIDQSRKNYVLFKLKNEENLSQNEYLIALTSLLKMIKRQNETDLAQLLSFTYYHKLYCYDLGCICQFFTQYCQDPQKFKLKKRRIYRGYTDNGQKLVQILDEELSSDATHTMGSINTYANPNEGSNALNNKLNGQGEYRGTRMLQIGVKQDTNMAQSVRQGEIGLDVNNNATNGMNNEDSNIDNAPLDYSQIELNGAVSKYDQQQTDQNTKDNYEAEISAPSPGQAITQNMFEYKEQGLKAQFVKNLILKGNAFNGFDSNLDFKVKGEFKSPSQFKNVEESRTYFFTRLLETMFKQLEQRTSKNTSFTLISIFFHYFYQHNVYMAAINLIKLAKSLSRSTLEKMTFSVTEYYLLEQIMNHFKQNTKDEIDYQQFIEISQMQQRLDWLFEDASMEIIQFWRLFKEEQANVQRSYHLAMNISKNIAVIRDYTNQLEEKQLIKDYNKYYFYAMFYQNLLNDRQQYNQMISNLKNLLMVKNMQKKNSRFGVINQDINDIGFAIFSIEDGSLMDKNVGKFIYCNQSACQMLKISEEEVIGKAAAILMPEQIRMHHDFFVRRFMQDGLPRLIGKVRNMYIRDFTGYIKPVQFFFNFYYSSKFNYTFLVHLDPIQSYTYFGSPLQISMKHVMIFLCSQSNNILNMTENVRKILGLTFKRIREEEEILGRELRIDDVIQSFSRIENVITINKFTFMPNQLVKARNFRGEATASATDGFSRGSAFNGDQSYLPCSLTYEENVYLKDHSGRFVEKVYILIPSSKVPELDTTSTNITTSQLVSQAVNDQASNDIQVDSNTFGDSIDEQINNNMSPSCSSIGSSSSGNSSSGIASTKNLLFQQKSPKILNLYLSIVFGVFLSFMVITSINFIIYIQKKNNVNLQITINQVINQRNIYLSSTILDLKQLHLISQRKSEANAIKSNFSNILPPPNNTNRFGQFTDVLISDEKTLQNNHEVFKQQLHRYPQITRDQNLTTIRDIKYKLISDLGKPYYQNNTLDYGIQLLISNQAMIKARQFNDETLPLNLDSYLEGLNGTQKVSQLFKNLYYIYFNGMGQIKNLVQVQNEQLLQSTQKTSKDNNLFINLISFISIGMITFIGIFTFPMLGKIEDRKISVLKFFNLLNIEQIQDLIKKGEDYQQEFQGLQRGANYGGNSSFGQGRNAIDKDIDSDGFGEFGSDDAFATINQVADEYGIVQKRDEFSQVQIIVNSETFAKEEKISKKGNGGKMTRFAQDQKQKDSKHNDNGSANLGMSQKPNYVRSKFGKKKNELTNTAAQGIKDIFQRIKINENQTQFQKKKTTKIQKSNSNVKTSIRANQYAVGQVEELKVNEIKSSLKRSHKENGDKNKGSGKKNQDDVTSIKASKNEDSSSNSDDDKAEKKHHKKQINLDDEKGGQDQPQSNSVNRTTHINEQLGKVAMKEKVKLAFYVFIVLLFLNSCLIACFSIGQKTFSEDSKAIEALTTFYHRQNCLENLMLYSMEQFVQNKTIKIDGFDRDAVSYYLNYCEIHEKEYNEVRRNIPVFLESAQSQIENLESSNLCRTIYKASEQLQIDTCENVYDQIMKRGLTSSLYTIYNYAQSMNVRFNKEARTQTFLNRLLFEDQKFRDLIDLMKTYIHQSFVHIQQIVTDAATNYFNNLAKIYMIIYGCYMGISILLCLFFGLFVFKTLRQQIITSANILAIMPLEELESRERQKIEAFLNS